MVSGTVVDNEENPLSNATVKVPRYSLTGPTVTDENGEFSIVVKDHWDHTLMASRDGY